MYAATPFFLNLFFDKWDHNGEVNVTVLKTFNGYVQTQHKLRILLSGYANCDVESLYPAIK